MRRKFALILVLLSVGCGSLHAITPVVNIGVEWGVEPQIASMHKFNYVCAEGYRVNDQWSGIDYHTNANVLANISFNLGNWFRLGLYSGYAGVSKDVRIIPLTLRLSVFPKGTAESGFLYFIDGGAGFHLNDSSAPYQAPCVLVKAGAGYRSTLSKNASLDFLLSVRGAIDSPLIQDPDGHGYVMDVRYSSAAYLALCFGIALNF